MAHAFLVTRDPRGRLTRLRYLRDVLHERIDRAIDDAEGRVWTPDAKPALRLVAGGHSEGKRS